MTSGTTSADPALPQPRPAAPVVSVVSPEATQRLRIRVLGDVTATLDGSPIDLGGPRQRSVLGLLVVARGDVVPAERIVDELWGDASPPSAMSALQAYISHLRRRLEPDRGPRDRQSVIPRQGPGYSLQVAPDAVDAWEFERLQQEASRAAEPEATVALLDQALSLWRGPAFADHLGQPWADAESARLAGLRDVAREARIEARLQTGESAVLVPELEALVAEDPLREQRWRLLVLALYRAHRQADALAALRRARTTLSEELGVDPGPGLRALEADVLAQSPSLELPVRPSASAAPTTPAAAPAADQPAAATAPPPAAAPEDLVDREQELTTLRAAVDDALGGTGRMLVIDGAAGIGKSRLLAEVRRMAAERGATVLTARGSQLEREFAFGVVRQLFEASLADPQQRETLLSGAAAPAASVFADVTGGPGSAEAHDGSFSVLHGLYWLTVHLSGNGPLVLAVDDLQWCDTGSLRALAYLLRRVEGLPVLVATTLRTGEAPADEALIAELVSDLSTQSLHPGPIGRDGTAALVRARLGEPAHEAFVAACHRTTGGNPLLLRQLLRALEADGIRPDAAHTDTVNAIGSRAVSSIVLMRLRRLPAEATTVARAVAILGDDTELPLVARLANLPEGRTAEVITTLTRGELLRTDGPPGFVHPLVREAVYLDLSPGERELHHERAARLLREAGATPEQVAAHLLLAPRRNDPEAVEILRAAAATAATRGAPDAGAAYLERALLEPPPQTERACIVADLGNLATMTDGRAAVDRLREAHAAVTDPGDRAYIAVLLARTLVFAGERGEATALARAAYAETPEAMDDTRQALLALERITGYMHGIPQQEWRRGNPEPRGDGLGARMLATALSWEAYIDGVDRARAIELAEFALRDNALLESDPGLFWIVAGNILELSDVDRLSFWDTALAHAYSRGSLFSALSVHLWRGHVLWHRGQLIEALQSVETSTQQSYMWGSTNVGATYGHAFVLGILLECGALPQAREYVDPLLDEPRTGDGERLFYENYARLLAAEGRHRDALELLEVTESMSDVANPSWRSWRSYRAPVLAALGQVEQARALMVEEVAAARRWGAPTLVGRTLRCAGELGGPGADEMLREAHDLLEPSVARYEYARAALALGRVVEDSSERESLLRNAAGTALECGSAGLYLEAAHALRDLGVVVPLDAADTVIVTQSERRMALRAAAGFSYREIAEEFFLTPAVVEHMLRDLRQRVGVPTDAELPEAISTL